MAGSRVQPIMKFDSIRETSSRPARLIDINLSHPIAKFIPTAAIAVPVKSRDFRVEQLLTKCEPICVRVVVLGSTTDSNCRHPSAKWESMDDNLIKLERSTTSNFSHPSTKCEPMDLTPDIFPMWRVVRFVHPEAKLEPMVVICTIVDMSRVVRDVHFVAKKDPMEVTCVRGERSTDGRQHAPYKKWFGIVMIPLRPDRFTDLTRAQQERNCSPIDVRFSMEVSRAVSLAHPLSMDPMLGRFLRGVRSIVDTSEPARRAPMVLTFTNPSKLTDDKVPMHNALSIDVTLLRGVVSS